MSLPGLYAVWRGTMVALGVAAVVPARTGDVRSHARPIHSYEKAVTQARSMIAARDSDAAEGGATILRVHERRGASASELVPSALLALARGQEAPRWMVHR